MNESDICRHLDEKVEELLELLPFELREDFLEEMYFAGGCIYSLANGKQPKDYDIFLKSNKFIDKLKNLELWKCKTEYALSYGKFQVIIKFYGEPKETVDQFDFKHNMHWYEPYKHKIKCGYIEDLDDTYFDDYDYIHTNELIFNEKRARDCDNVWIRIDKFVSRGMKITKKTKKQILSKTSKKEIKIARKRHKESGNRGGY